MSHLTSMYCPCGSGVALATCCQPYHQGEPAPTPEALMRSRYSAFALQLTEYLLSTWHASTRLAQLSPDPATQWKALTILAAPTATDDKGVVHFMAYFREQNRWQVLEEKSRFVREGGNWWYVDGVPKVERLKPGRNDRCLCGSGRKIKQCCGE